MRQVCKALGEIRPNLEIRRILQQFLCVLLVEIATFFEKKSNMLNPEALSELRQKLKK